MLGMHMLRYKKNIWKAMIRLDNQSIITVLDIRKPKIAQYIIDKFLQQAERKWKCADKTTYSLEMTWVKGHAKIEGNERVDAEAKKAARGKQARHVTGM